MFDQFIISDLSSEKDFDASISERRITDGKKKEIKETVPFSNITYDFSAINGEVYWEEKILEYDLEILAQTPEQLEEKKIALKNWLMNVQNEELIDPFIKDYHFIVTFRNLSFDDEIEKTTAKVAFTAYPYMIANEETVYNFDLVADIEKTVEILNESSHRIVPIFECIKGIIVTVGNLEHAIKAGETKDNTLMLKVGTNIIKLKSNENCNVKISFFCEVL